MIEVFREILGSLSRNKLRSLATGFAVACGIFLLIILQGTSNGIIHTFEQASAGFAFDAIHVFPGFTSKPFNGIKEGRRIKLDDSDSEVTLSNFPNELSSVIAQISHTANSASFGKNYLSNVSLQGARPETQEMEALRLITGRFINKIDLDEQRKVIVMGDMNDDPQDASMSKCLGAKRWQKDVGEGDLWNPWWNVLASGTGTLSYQGSWNLFDQIILSPSLIRPQQGTLGYQDCEVFRRNYLIQKKGRYRGTPLRTHAGGEWLNGYSDHLPTVVYLKR